MPRRSPAMLNEDNKTASKDPHAERKRPAPGGEYMKARRREVYVFLVFVGTTAILTSIFLWAIGIIGPSSWYNENGSQVHFLSGSPDVLDEFLKTRQNDKVALAFFSTSCPHCRRMRAPFLQCSREFTDVTFIGINAAKNYELAQRFKLDVVPSILWLASGSRLDNPTMYPGQPRFGELKQFFNERLTDVESAE